MGAGFLASVNRLDAIIAQGPSDRHRATDGDEEARVDWSDGLTITVGQKSGDIVGNDDKAIQAAVDYVTRLGKGTVKIGPGVYRLRNAIHLSTGIHLMGSGADSILTKIPSEEVMLADDSDWYDQEITLVKAADFQVGDGVALMGDSPHHGGAQVIKRTLVARNGNRFKLDKGLRKNLWVSQKPKCTSLFPLLTSENCSDVLIENLCLDGNLEQNANFNGNYGGNIFLQDCRRFTIRNVESRNYNGDGISFQICHDVTSMATGGMGCILVQVRSDRSCVVIVWTPIILACSGAGASSTGLPRATACMETSQRGCRSATTILIM